VKNIHFMGLLRRGFQDLNTVKTHKKH
jgi:hypothetical protein